MCSDPQKGRDLSPMFSHGKAAEKSIKKFESSAELPGWDSLDEGPLVV